VPFTYSCWTIFLRPEVSATRLRGATHLGRVSRAMRKNPGHRPRAAQLARRYGTIPMPSSRGLLQSRRRRRLARAQRAGARARLDPRYLHSAALLQRLAQNYLVRGWEGMTHTAAQQAFLLGQSAMTVSAPGSSTKMEGKIPAGFELGVMNFSRVSRRRGRSERRFKPAAIVFSCSPPADSAARKVDPGFSALPHLGGRPRHLFRRMDSLVAVAACRARRTRRACRRRRRWSRRRRSRSTCRR